MRLFILLSLWLAGCTLGQETLAPGACVNNTDCEDNELCIAETCQTVQCTTSSECGLGQYCNDTFSCTDGCAEDSDCVAGESCDTLVNTCVSYGCRDTQLDCGYGELCDPTSGQCYTDTAPHCESCESSLDCPGGECFSLFTTQSCSTQADCPFGYRCQSFEGERRCFSNSCIIECTPAAADSCPRGLSCVTFGEDGFSGCLGDCEYLLENGL